MLRLTTLYLGLAGVFLSAEVLAAAPQGKPAAKKPPKPAPVSTPTSTVGAFVLVDLTADANDNFAQPIGKSPLHVGTVPFQLPQGDHDHLSLRQAQWTGWQQDLPWSHESPSPKTEHDPAMPIVRVPVADYIAAHVLAVADDDPGLVPVFTLRMGSIPRTGNEQCVQFDFAGRAPRRSQAVPNQDVAVNTAGENLYYVRVPTPFAFAQDLTPDKSLAIELTKEIRLARRSPDPNRFHYRPLGLPSGVRVAALTLEKSPLQMRVNSDQTGHAFVEPQTPTFRISLTSILPTAQAYALSVQAVSLQGTKVAAERSGRVAAETTTEISVPLAVGQRGYYDLTVTLTDGSQRTLLRRETSFALLPPDTRLHRDQSPFGTYDYGGSHYTCPDPDQIGPLFVKLGLRYGLFSYRALDARRTYGLLKGNEPNITNPQAARQYDAILAKNPDLPPMALIFHETSLSESHITRVPNLFTDRQYTLRPEEQERFQVLWASAVSAAQTMRQTHPDVKLALGNGPLPTKEEFLRRKFPAELFDSAGNEAGAFGHPPEAQPPDWLANNASLWMDRQLLDAFGYRDKPVTQCHEVCYPGTNPGNLDVRTQADYFVRHALHSLAWGVPAFRPGLIADVGGNYRWSHWGAAGFCHMYPELNVKPSFVAFATMTWVLDGAKFIRDVSLSSPSLYAVEFSKPQGANAFALWTLRGARPVVLTVSGNGPWQIIDSQANERAGRLVEGKLQLQLTPSPVYLVGHGHITDAVPGAPAYDDKPEGEVTALSALDTLDDWVVQREPSPELEYYNFMTPRRRGDFLFQAVPARDGQDAMLRVAPQPITRGKDTMPMYAVLAHKVGLPIPGTPTEIGLWVDGNSGWGRVIFELTDVSGQRWISLGAQAKADPAKFLPADVLARFPSPGVSDWNTEDAWGLSRINFDGWRYVGFSLPGNYPGEHYGWPANSQWRWDRNGVVHYPFTLRKLVVELNEKVLHLRTFAPPPRPAVCLKRLVVAQGDTVRVKQSAGD